MKTNQDQFTNQNYEEGVPLLDSKKVWMICLISGLLFWIIGLVLWRQQGIDEKVLFYLNTARIGKDFIVILSQWLTTYGMAAITGIFVIYLLASQKTKLLGAPLTIYLYTIISFGLSGITGDMLKIIFARPRPLTTFGNEIMVLSQSMSLSLPSGHTTKSIALVLPFILLIPNSNNVHKAIKVIIAVLACGVGLSRIVLGAHYVSDVFAGLGMAFIGLPFSMLLANMILKKNERRTAPILI
ncbi:MAG: phosphatase PAP2 family protein [Anaerolineaceae bacterium]|nr:phosphatase PAP2 family protein [Anaerolineaceae bacterium]